MQYLEQLVNRTAKPQETLIRQDNLPLGDSYQLCTTLGVPNYALNNLFKILQGEMALASTHLELQKSDSRLKKPFVYSVEPSLPLNLSSPLNC